MKKAPEAFRTISEVAEILETPAHVLRFWESKFYQIRPVKRAGGRRYYRPDDVALINGIKVLLQDQGMTIRGVQRVLQEQGVKHVAGLGFPLPLLAAAPEEAMLEDAFDEDDDVVAPEMDDAEEIPDSAEPWSEPVADSPQDLPLPVDSEVVVPFAAAPAPAETAPAVTAEADPSEVLTDDGEDAEPEAAEIEAVEPETVDALEPPEDVDVPPVIDIPAETPVVARATAETQARDPAPLEVMEPSDRALIARHLRSLSRNGLGTKRDRAEMLARRIDGLLERMSEASGAGRW